jgi:arylsulfatase A-like enzyme
MRTNAAALTLAAAAAATLAAVPVAAQDTPVAPPGGKYNVLFIAVDDLRPSIGAYGGPIKTPNIDRLAARGTTFLRAYCQQAVCSPSRTSLLTGLRPDATRVYDLETHFRKNLPDVVTLPQYFKRSGYRAEGMGKIYHPGLDDAESWSVPHVEPRRPQWGPEGAKIQARNVAAAKAAGDERNTGGARWLRGPAYESVEGVDDDYFVDGAVAARAVETLRARKTDNKPFFLAVGFARPHLPFVAPKKYWDLYRPEDIRLPANYTKAPENAVPIALHTWGELRSYDAIPKQGPVSDAQAKSLLHGYYASASYMDAQVGRVLDELERSGLADKTVVVLWGDHGWSLGEHGIWAKHTNFEDAAHAPLILSVPGQRRKGAKATRLAEFVDVYPTLCEAVSLPVPGGLAGNSLLAVTNNPDAPTKDAAFSQYPRGGPRVPGGRVMGYSMRTNRYRYTEWGIHGAELYDHETDPAENVNIAALPGSRALVADLSRRLHAALPGAAEQARRAEARATAAAAKP